MNSFRADDAGPNEPPELPSPLVDAVLALLEQHHVPQALCDDIVRAIEQWEQHHA